MTGTIFVIPAEAGCCMTMNPEQVPTYECLWPAQDTQTTCVHPDTFEGQGHFSIKPLNDNLRARMVDILEKGMERGEVHRANADDMAMVIYGILFTASDQLIFNLFSEFDENKMESMLDLVLGCFYMENAAVPAE